jgi:hypothetical protein
MKKEDLAIEKNNRAIRNSPFYCISKGIFRFNPSWKALLAYNALAYYAEGRSGSCEDFSLKTLAAKVNTSKWTIIRGLEELENKGIIVRHRRSKQKKAGEKEGGRIPLPTLYELCDIDSIKGEPI